jgi:hypothetical protein
VIPAALHAENSAQALRTAPPTGASIAALVAAVMPVVVTSFEAV